jgi:hypothetical protein
MNSRLLDGRQNPYFGRPYLSMNPYLEVAPSERDNYRGQAAYMLDLRDEQGWLRWLGSHSLSGYAEYKEIVSRRERWRHAILSDHSWFPAGVGRGSNANQIVGGRPGIPTNVLAAPSLRLYVGDNVGSNVDYGPQYFATGPTTLVFGNGANMTNEQVLIGPAVANGTGGPSNNRSILKSGGMVWQGHLLRDRIIPTLGMRHDESYTTTGGNFISPDGINIDYTSFNSWAPTDWVKSKGPTRTKGVVVRPLPWLNLYANQSDSFRPSSPKQDLYLNRLPEPAGIGKDYGVGMNLYDNRVVLRFNRYITRQVKTPNGPSATFVSRIRRIDFTEFNAESNPSTDPFTLQTLATGWVRQEAATP